MENMDELLDNIITDVTEDNRVDTLLEDPSSATYISKENVLETSATSIKIIVDAHVSESNDIKAFYAISESENESVLALTVVSHWADFEKRSGRLTNNNSQQRFFSTDVGMNFSSQTVLDIKWGRK